MTIDWHYVKDEPIPLNGSITWVAVHDNKTGKNKVIKVHNTISNVLLLIDEPVTYYAWAPFDFFYECDLIPAPVYMEEE